MNRSFKIDRKFVPLLATVGLFTIGYILGAIQYPGMARPQTFFNLFIDNAFLLIAATGLTLVIISGGIDLSVGACVVLAAVAQVMMPIGLTTAGGSIRLAGAYLTVNGQRVDLGEVVTLPAGAALSVTLIWDTLAAVPADYTVFVHLLGTDGQLVAQHDGTPLFGTRPTSTWQPGERLLDRHDFVLPEGVGVPAGVLRAGLYLPATLERLPFSHGEDGVQLAGVLFQ